MNTVKLQVPMDKDVRDALERRAEELGFDSAQAYIRFWAKAEADGRTVSMGEDSWGEPSLKAARELNKRASEALSDDKSGKLKSYSSVDDFMKDLDA